MVISAVWKQSHWDAQAAPVGIRVRAKVEGWQPSYPFDVLISDLKYVLRYILMIKNNSPCKICKAGEPSLFRSKCSSKKTMVIDSEPFGHFFHSTTCTASSPAHMVSHVKLTYIPDNLPLDHHGFKNQLWSCRDFWNQQLKNNHKYPEAQAATTHRFWDDPKGRCDVFPKGKKQSSLVFESSD